MWSEEAPGLGTITCNGHEILYTIIYSDRRKSWAVGQWHQEPCLG